MKAYSVLQWNWKASPSAKLSGTYVEPGLPDSSCRQRLMKAHTRL